jgi:hypothetical protein
MEKVNNNNNSNKKRDLKIIHSLLMILAKIEIMPKQISIIISVWNNGNDDINLTHYNFKF